LPSPTPVSFSALSYFFSSSKNRAKQLFGLGLVVNFGALCYFKYTNFLLGNIWCLAEAIQGHLSWSSSVANQSQAPVMSIILPLGISFFVFEFVHYLFDIYKGSTPIKSFGNFAAFAAFFPSQIAGPIKRYQDFNKRLENPEPWSSALAYEAIALIAQGLFKKVAIADPIGAAIAPSFALGQVPGLDAFLAALGFAIQLYCDFSGYTDIGRGSALLLGIRLPINFNLPYMTKDVLDYWRRWHISLSTWFRDYLYIPLGGSRNGNFQAMRNTFITMVVCGLWHGASWNYVLFGVMHGLGMGVNRTWRQFLGEHPNLAKSIDNWLGATVCRMSFWTFYLGSLIIFRCCDLSKAFAMFTSLTDWHAQSVLTERLLKAGVFQILLVYSAYWAATELAKNKRLPKFLVGASIGALPQESNLLFTPSLRFASWTAAVLLIAAVCPTDAVPFVYFQF
jgi:alginate O-acetyltransferase complex protein AlgI